MLPSDSSAVVDSFLGDRGLDIETSSLAEIVEGILAFYNTVDASGLAEESDADMLLFQFGVYDWGSGKNFEFDLTRQFVVADEIDDDAISQLSCKFFYEPTPILTAIGSGERWCRSRLELPAFRTFIFSSAAFTTACTLPALRRRIEWGPV